METNTIETNTPNTQTQATKITVNNAVSSTVATTKINVVNATATKRTGRKPTVINEIANKNFTILDLLAINSSVKLPTLRAFVSRKVETGRYSVVSVQKNGGRGKPANIYQLNSN